MQCGRLQHLIFTQAEYIVPTGPYNLDTKRNSNFQALHLHDCNRIQECCSEKERIQNFQDAVRHICMLHLERNLSRKMIFSKTIYPKTEVLHTTRVLPKYSCEDERGK